MGLFGKKGGAGEDMAPGATSADAKRMKILVGTAVVLGLGTVVNFLVIRPALKPHDAGVVITGVGGQPIDPETRRQAELALARANGKAPPADTAPNTPARAAAPTDAPKEQAAKAGSPSAPTPATPPAPTGTPNTNATLSAPTAPPEAPARPERQGMLDLPPAVMQATLEPLRAARALMDVEPAPAPREPQAVASKPRQGDQSGVRPTAARPEKPARVPTALEQYARGETHSAIERLQSNVAAGTADESAHDLLAAMLVDQGRFAEARNVLAKRIEKGPTAGLAMKVARLALEADGPAAAEATLAQYAALGAQDHAYRAFRAAMLRRMGMTREAMTELQAAIALKPQTQYTSVLRDWTAAGDADGHQRLAGLKN